ncbi:uncharacterized protein LOC120405988 isoform X7 [Mauremys reevesii]|uniref:uncharacterized protein LOC120405988 isoform X7 n=1 Tax=Mauremys reevesii TaxID=260615 RepID=UPI00193F7E46|nr:uncharacterized protein LOC120405988 isoform X7 [Mauremys reevesii]
MAKFLAELLGCTLPDKGTSSMFESRSQSRIGLKQSTKQKTTTFSTLANEKSVSDRKWMPARILKDQPHLQLMTSHKLMIHTGVTTTYQT